jgi:hypothetical protein
MPESDWTLQAFSQMLFEQAARNEEERKKVEALIAHLLVVFVPDEDNPQMGVGWFKLPAHFRAYRKMMNGYEKYPIATLEFDLLRQLLPHMPLE